MSFGVLLFRAETLFLVSIKVPPTLVWNSSQGCGNTQGCAWGCRVVLVSRCRWDLEPQSRFRGQRAPDWHPSISICLACAYWDNPWKILSFDVAWIAIWVKFTQRPTFNGWKDVVPKKAGCSKLFWNSLPYGQWIIKSPKSRQFIL